MFIASEAFFLLLILFVNMSLDISKSFIQTFTTYRCNSHVGHVTWIARKKNWFPQALKRLYYMTFGNSLSSSFRDDV